MSENPIYCKMTDTHIESCKCCIGKVFVLSSTYVERVGHNCGSRCAELVLFYNKAGFSSSVSKYQQLTEEEQKTLRILYS